MSEAYKLKLIEIARDLSDEEFDRFVERLHKLELQLHATREAGEALGEQFQAIAAVFDLLQETTKEKQEEAQSQEDPGLCPNCARKCGEEKPYTMVCRNHYEFIPEKCPNCINWDVEICESIEPCTKAQFFQPKDPVAIRV